MRLFVRFRERECIEFLSFSMALYIRHTTTESSDGFTSISSLPPTYSIRMNSLDLDVRKKRRLSRSIYRTSPRASTVSRLGFSSTQYWIVGPVHLSQKQFQDAERSSCPEQFVLQRKHCKRCSSAAQYRLTRDQLLFTRNHSPLQPTPNSGM